jgi:hypothetical protein
MPIKIAALSKAWAFFYSPSTGIMNLNAIWGMAIGLLFYICVVLNGCRLCDAYISRPGCSIEYLQTTF